jgi:hypothetical protein
MEATERLQSGFQNALHEGSPKESLLDHKRVVDNIEDL